MPRKYLDLLIVPHDAGQIRRLRVPRIPRAVLFGALIAATVFVTGAGISFLRMFALSRQNAVLLAENDGLRQELVDLGGEVHRLDGAVRAQIQLANDTRVLAGLPPVPEDATLLGGAVGGPAPSEDAGLPDPTSETIGLYHERLERLGNQLELDKQGFADAKKAILVSKERMEHIPSVHPVKGACSFSSGFGFRLDPFTGRTAMHEGCDFSAPRGTPFCASADGRVVFAGRDGQLGLVVRIDHGNGLVSIYCHAERVLVNKGDSVKRGDAIGRVGSTGRATGAHLHYEIHNDGQPVNPVKYIP